MQAKNSRSFAEQSVFASSIPSSLWGASKFYLLVLSSWKVNIAENPIDVMGL